MEKIFAREEKICEFQDKAREAVAKIGKCVLIQYRKNFSPLKPQGSRPLKNSRAI